MGIRLMSDCTYLLRSVIGTLFSFVISCSVFSIVYVFYRFTACLSIVVIRFANLYAGANM